VKTVRFFCFFSVLPFFAAGFAEAGSRLFAEKNASLFAVELKLSDNLYKPCVFGFCLRAGKPSCNPDTLLCGPRLARLAVFGAPGRATVFQPAKHVWGGLDTRVWGLRFGMSSRDALSHKSVA
jgi:hypothetical protein